MQHWLEQGKPTEETVLFMCVGAMTGPDLRVSNVSMVGLKNKFGGCT